MPRVERQERADLGVSGRSGDDGVVGPPPSDSRRGQSFEQVHVRGTAEGNDGGVRHEVCVHQSPCVSWRKSVRRGQTCQDRIAFDESVGGNGHALTAAEALFDFSRGGGVVLVPAADGCDHAARIEGECGHVYRRLRRAARSRLVRSTVAVVSRGTALDGDATSSRPFRVSVTARACGSISMTPSRHRTSSGTPGSSAASRRISRGMTSRPAGSMVVTMVGIIPSPRSCDITADLHRGLLRGLS